MMRDKSLSRRSLLQALGASAVAGSVAGAPTWSFAAGRVREFRLKAAPATAQIARLTHGKTPVLAFNGAVPGPEIRVRQGERVRVIAENGLDENTTVHWHGLRVPNRMDGVPDLTQAPIKPGGSFDYVFDVPDAGTYWYHPHFNSSQQVGRGLYGALIVEEREPIKVDRDITWLLDDWRLTRDAGISGDFGNFHDLSHNGRIGNTVTINGQITDTVTVRAGERIRLRLINAANARIFGLDFAGHEPHVIALDGQPVEPHRPADGRVVLGPGMRVDVVIDMMGRTGQRFAVTDGFYRRQAYRLIELVYAGEPLRKLPLETSIALPPNTLPEPELAAAQRHEIVFNGGMMGGMMMGGRGPGRAEMMEMMRAGRMWFINGVAASGHVMKPMLTLEKGKSYRLDMHNQTAWHHPIHLHGHSFRVVARDGQTTPYLPWQDTVLMNPRERVEIAFVADNPGDWMFHCHILEHQESGMMGVIRVDNGTRRI